VQKCDKCGYLIPPAWEECRRCSAAVDAPAPVPATTAVAPPWSPNAAAPPAAPPIASPPASGYDERYASTARIGLPGAPTSNGAGPFNPYERVPAASSQWSSGTTVKRAPSSLKKIAALTLMLVGGFMGWKYVQAWRNSVPEEVKEYVDGGGVEYAPPGLGYSVRLPEQPVEDAQTRDVNGMTVTVHIACNQKDRWEACAGVTQLPVALDDAQAESAMRAAVSAGNAAAQGEIASTELTTHAGMPAMEAELEAPDGYPARVLVVLSGSRMFMLVAHSAQGTDQIYDEMVESLQITNTAA
jgi:hypothetical protein